MPRLVHRTPKYRKHSTGQAFVSIGGRPVYLGKYGTDASRAEYSRVIAEYLAAGRRGAGEDPGGFEVVELIDAFWTWAQTYYAREDGRNGELDNYKTALKLLKRDYGGTLTSDFRPLCFKVVQREMIQAGWARTHVNRQMGRLRSVFKWGVAEEMAPPAVLHGLQAVAGLRRGKSEARESDPVAPVADELVEAVRPHVSEQVWAMIELQRVTGMRPGEVVIMRRRDLDTGGKLWTYTPGRHKTQHHGHKRVVWLGPRAQELVTPFLPADLDAYLFSPTEAEGARRAEAREDAGRGEVVLPARKRRPRRAPGERYTVDAYRRAIARGCDAAFPPAGDLARGRVAASGRKKERAETAAEWQGRLGERWGEVEVWRTSHRWHPHQLRHNAATKLRKDYGLEAAQVILGHKTLSVTQIYAEKNVEAARRIMGEVG